MIPFVHVVWHVMAAKHGKLKVCNFVSCDVVMVCDCHHNCCLGSRKSHYLPDTICNQKIRKIKRICSYDDDLLDL
jgi:hypothetical protein